MDKKLKHLEMIQGIVNRVASNSFLLKGWAVTITSALVALSFKSKIDEYSWFIITPLLLFWFLDAYYLSQEKIFRDLYEDVRKKENNEIDFSMNCDHIKNDKNNWLAALFSNTLLLFYGVSLSIIILYLHLMGGA